MAQWEKTLRTFILLLFFFFFFFFFLFFFFLFFFFLCSHFYVPIRSPQSQLEAIRALSKRNSAVALGSHIVGTKTSDDADHDDDERVGVRAAAGGSLPVAAKPAMQEGKQGEEDGDDDEDDDDDDDDDDETEAVAEAKKGAAGGGSVGRPVERPAAHEAEEDEDDEDDDLDEDDKARLITHIASRLRGTALAAALTRAPSAEARHRILIHAASSIDE
jgi:hypothetical protein